MPVTPEQFGLQFPNDRPRPNLATRFVTNMKETVSAMPQGLWMLGKAGVGDIGRGIGEVATLGQLDTDFQTPELGKAMWTGFKEESFVPALLTGRFGEAGRRASDRPFDAMLDAMGLTFGGYGAAAKGATLAAPFAKGGARASLMRPSGFRPAADIIDDPALLSRYTKGRPEELGDFPFAKPITSSKSDYKYQLKNVGDELYARRVARRLKDADDNRYNAWSRRSSNELAAKIGDFMQTGFARLPESAPLLGSLTRIEKQLKKDRYAMRNLDRDRMRIKYDTAKGKFERRASRRLEGKSDAEKAFIIGAASMIGNKGGASTAWELKYIDNFYGNKDAGIEPRGWEVVTKHKEELKALEDAHRKAQEDLVNLLPEAQRLARETYGDDYLGDIAYFPESRKGDPRLVDETMQKLGVEDYGEYAGLTGNQQVLRMLEWLDDENALASGWTGSGKVGTNRGPLPIRQQVYMLSRRINEHQSMIDRLEGRLKESAANQGKLPNKILKRRAKLARYRKEIDSILQSDEIEDWLNFIGDEVAPDMLAKYQQNVGDPGFDPRPHIFRNQYMFRGKRWDDDIAPGAEVNVSLLDQMGIERIDPRTGRLRMPSFAPSLPPRAAPKGERIKGKQKLADSETPLEYKATIEGDPLELLIKGNERWDLDIWYDRWERENNTFSHNAYSEHILEHSPMVTMAQARRAEKDGAATFTEKGGGMTRPDAPTVLVPKGAGPAVEARRVQHIMEIVAEELGRAGVTAAARPMTRWLDDIDPKQLESLFAGYNHEVMKKMRRGYEEAAATPLQKWKEAGKPTPKDEPAFYQVPRHLYDAMVADTARSQHFLARMLDGPTEFWKNLVLHLRPKWMVNNAAGSMFLLALSEGGFDAIRLLLKNNKTLDRIGKMLYGEQMWKQRQRDKGKLINVGGRELTIREFLEERMPEVSAATGSNWLYRTDFLRGSSNKFARNYNRLMNAIADFNAAWADDPARMAKATAVVERRLKAVKDAYKQKGRYRVVDGREQFLRQSSVTDPTGKLRSKEGVPEEVPRVQWEDIDDGELIKGMLNDDVLRKDIADEVLGDMIDFQDLTPFEREWVRRFIPFYSWIKGASRVGFKAGYEHPVHMWMLGQAGQEGTRELERRYGEGLLPSFLYGSIAGEGPNVRFAGGMNPLQTPVDVATLAAAAIPFVGSTHPVYGGESPVAMMGPLPKGIISGLSGRDFFYGTPLPRGQSLGTSMLKQTVAVPQWDIIQSFFRDQGPGAVAVHDPMSRVTSYLGMPRKLQLRPVQVRQRALEERAEALG